MIGVMAAPKGFVRSFPVVTLLVACSVSACDGSALKKGSPDGDASSSDADAASHDGDGGSSDGVGGPRDAASTADAPPADCLAAVLSPPASAIQPRSAVAESCAIVAGATAWTYPENPHVLDDGNWRIVGRWAPCGATLSGIAAHAGIEFGANRRWRLLTVDAGTGALVPLTGPGAASGYYDLQDGVGFGTMTMPGELPGQTLWSGQVTFAAAGDALRFAGQSSTAQVYSRTTPSTDDGASNPSSTMDGHCSMVGTWDVPAGSDPGSLGAAVFSFDAAGHFAGGPEGTDLCASQTMYGTYALSSSGFQLVTGSGLGGCDGRYLASYTATFDGSCDKVVLTPTHDECTADRGYFGKPTTLSRRPAGADGGAGMPPEAGAPRVAVFDADCWQSQLPPAPEPMMPPASTTNLCAAALSATDWDYLSAPPEIVEDYRKHIVGRWSACGPKIAQLPAHAGIELGANGRWRLLALDGGNGGLVPLAATGAVSGYYYAMSHDRKQKYGALVLLGELPTGTTWNFLVQYSNNENAIRFNSNSGEAGPIYARAAASPDNGAGNPPPTADGACSMVGTWDMLTGDDPLGPPPAVIAFDEEGNFVGGPEGIDLCRYNYFSGTYALASGLFQLTSGLGMRPCDWWTRALYAATFDPTCNQLSISPISDACEGTRGYLHEPRTLRRRVPPSARP